MNSPRLMGLQVNSTKVLVYTLSGLCSGLAGIALSVFVLSGHGLYADGAEMDVIASVVMGGTMLTGGSGYVFGTPFGVLVFGITQTLIQFNGSLSSWWTRIVIGILTLIFIGVQSLVTAKRGGRRKELTPALRMRRLAYAATAVVVLAGSATALFTNSGRINSVIGTAEVKHCTLQPFRQELVPELINSGAIIVYERNGGPKCIDELYAFYPDGRITGDNGVATVEKQVSIEEVNMLLSGINNHGWFTDELYDTWHTPCGHATVTI